MLKNATILLQFEFDDDGADSLGDAQWEALHFVKEHIMDDEDKTPIIFKTFWIVDE